LTDNNDGGLSRMGNYFVAYRPHRKASFYCQIYFASASVGAYTKLFSLEWYQPLAEMRWLCKCIYRGT